MHKKLINDLNSGKARQLSDQNLIMMIIVKINHETMQLKNDLQTHQGVWLVKKNRKRKTNSHMQWK